ncbi:methylcobamide:CoM methyltransferase MtbA [Lachnospiraceae bacterium LCP25S3_G4]
MMTPKERLNNAIKGNKVDRIPCICPGGMMNMITEELMEICGIFLPDAHTNAQQMAVLASAAYEQGCFENYGVPFCMTVEAEALGAKVDMGNRVYEPHVTQYAIGSVEEWKKLAEIDATCGRVKVVTDAIRLLKETSADVPIIGNITGPISTATSVIEPVIFYKEMRKKPEEVHQYLRFITSQLKKIAKAQIEAGADVIAISDPSGTGEILGPKYFEEYAVTYLNELIHCIKEEAIGTIVHICGQMRAVYQEVNQVQSDVLSFDSIVSMRDAKKQLQKRVLMGNVSTYTLEFGTPQKVRELTKQCMMQGSSIISPACGLGMKSPLINIRAMRDEQCQR